MNKNVLVTIRPSSDPYGLRAMEDGPASGANVGHTVLHKQADVADLDPSEPLSPLDCVPRLMEDARRDPSIALDASHMAVAILEEITEQNFEARDVLVDWTRTLGTAIHKERPNHKHMAHIHSLSHTIEQFVAIAKPMAAALSRSQWRQEHAAGESHVSSDSFQFEGLGNNLASLTHELEQLRAECARMKDKYRMKQQAEMNRVRLATASPGHDRPTLCVLCV